ncbi:hypothetical protein R6Z07F_019612 [Ovis aries]
MLRKRPGGPDPVCGPDAPGLSTAGQQDPPTRSPGFTCRRAAREPAARHPPAVPSALAAAAERRQREPRAPRPAPGTRRRPDHAPDPAPGARPPPTRDPDPDPPGRQAPPPHARTPGPTPTPTPVPGHQAPPPITARAPGPAPALAPPLHAGDPSAEPREPSAVLDGRLAGSCVDQSGACQWQASQSTGEETPVTAGTHSTGQHCVQRVFPRILRLFGVPWCIRGAEVSSAHVHVPPPLSLLLNAEADTTVGSTKL